MQRDMDKVELRTYAVGVLSLRQSGTFHFNGVRFFRAAREKTAHDKKVKHRSAAGAARQLRKSYNYYWEECNAARRIS